MIFLMERNRVLILVTGTGGFECKEEIYGALSVVPVQGILVPHLACQYQLITLLLLTGLSILRIAASVPTLNYLLSIFGNLS